uniref:UGP3-like C-terminal hexapeptide repeats domain-containing protein n=1 Tax=Fagus sylvatica TaxID=28930 RepID=A0A2N9IX15_FAGSY
MAHLTPILQQNHRFLFSVKSKASNSHFPFHSLYLRKPLLPLSFSSSPFSSESSPSSCSVTRVSTAPVEYAPPPPDFNLHQEIARLKNLRSNLSDAGSLEEKLSAIDRDARVKQFFGELSGNGFSRVLASLNLDTYELFLVKCLVAAGQEHVLGFEFELSEFESARSSIKSALYALVEMIEKLDNGGDRLGNETRFGLKNEEIGEFEKLLKTLGEIEQFYDCIGGIIGYQITVLELLAQATCERKTTNCSHHINKLMECEFTEIHAPRGVDLLQNTEYASQAAMWGIEGLPELGEIYPLGGAADRLGLVDPDTGECLPAAMLPYCGRTLLEGLIRDLQAREFLYFKMYGKQCITPVAIMTSSAKKNHERITSLCERLGWFGRGRSSFQLFEQPLVPSVSAEDGQWVVSKSFTPVCKPGGHGVIWKLAYDKGIFKWFYDHGRKGATVRQVSNVVAATDSTLLALAGIGLHHGKKLGFASCERKLGATEGINVLIEKKALDGKWAYGLSCIEYTEFDKFGITNGPLSPKSVPGGRLECTMQNIADNFFNTSSSRCYNRVEADEMDTFIVYNERRRVTSSAKRKRTLADKSLHQTPDGSLLDILRNVHDLLSECDIRLPVIKGNDEYVDSGPPFLVLLHPALGPLWEVTRQKFHGGSISMGSELQLEVAEFLWRNVQLDGSLIIVAENVMGSMRIDENGEPILQYGQRCGRCKLQNVKVLNNGINWNSGNNIYWKHDVQRFEAFKVILHGNAEFEATDVVLQGNHVYEVPNGYKLKITPGKSGLSVQLDPIEQNMMDSGSWSWNYKIKGTHIQLEFVDYLLDYRNTLPYVNLGSQMVVEHTFIISTSSGLIG